MQERNLLGLGLLTVLAVLTSVQGLEVLSGPGVGKTINSPWLTALGPKGDWNITGEIIYFNETTLNQTERAGKIFLDYPRDPSFANRIQGFFDAGEQPIAVVFILSNPEVEKAGLGNYIRMGNDAVPPGNLPISAVQVSEFDSQLLRSWLNVTTGEKTIVYIDNKDFNAWGEMFESPLQWIYYTLVMGGLSIFLIVFASWKWYWFIRVQGWGYTIPNVVLPIEIIANFLRGFFFIVDPNLSRQLWSYLPSQILYTITFPLDLLCTFLITLYWHQLMTKSRMAKHSDFLTKMNIPFWIVFVIVMGFELASSIPRGLGLDFNTILLIVGLIYVVLSLIVVIYYFVIGLRLIIQLNRSSKIKFSKEGSNNSRLRSASMRIMASGLGQFAWCIVVAVGGMTSLLLSPWSFWTCWAVCYMLMIFTSFMQIAAFQPPRPNGGATASTAGNTTGSNRGGSARSGGSVSSHGSGNDSNTTATASK